MSTSSSGGSSARATLPPSLSTWSFTSPRSLRSVRYSLPVTVWSNALFSSAPIRPFSLSFWTNSTTFLSDRRASLFVSCAVVSWAIRSSRLTPSTSTSMSSAMASRSRSPRQRPRQRRARFCSRCSARCTLGEKSREISVSQKKITSHFLMWISEDPRSSGLEIGGGRRVRPTFRERSAREIERAHTQTHTDRRALTPE